MRDALSLLDQLISSGREPLTAQQLNELVGIPDRQKVMNLLSAVAAHDAAGVLKAIELLIDSGQSAGQICDLLVQNMRDMMIQQSAGPDNQVLILTVEEKQQLQQVGQHFDIAALIYNITTLEKLRWTLRTSETSRALLEASVLRLALSEHFIGLDQLGAALTGTRAVAAPLKKKTVETLFDTDDHSETSEPRNLTEPVSVAANIDAIKASWQQMSAQCEQTEPGLAVFLSQGRPISFDNTILTLQFSHTGQGQLARNMCERKISVIRSILSTVLSMEVTVHLELDKADSSRPIKDITTSPNSDTRLNRQQRQEALNDPTVQMVLKGLDATPIEIQKVEVEMNYSDDSFDSED
jgi:DNA polymerase III gamma/tau subunit